MADDFPLISADPAIHHGQACIRGTRLSVSVVLDCLAEGMTGDQILAEYPTLTSDGVQAALEYAAALAREEHRAFSRCCVKFKLDEDTPLRLAALLRERGNDADTVQDEGLTGSPDSRIAKAAADERRILISLDLGFSDIRAHPPGSHPGIAQV